MFLDGRYTHTPMFRNGTSLLTSALCLRVGLSLLVLSLLVGYRQQAIQHWSDPEPPDHSIIPIGSVMLTAVAGTTPAYSRPCQMDRCRPHQSLLLSCPSGCERKPYTLSANPNIALYAAFECACLQPVELAHPPPSPPDADRASDRGHRCLVLLAIVIVSVARISAGTSLFSCANTNSSPLPSLLRSVSARRRDHPQLGTGTSRSSASPPPFLPLFNVAVSTSSATQPPLLTLLRAHTSAHVQREVGRNRRTQRDRFVRPRRVGR